MSEFGAKADEGRALVDVRHQASVKIWTLPDLSRNSLLSVWNSLLVEKISLIVCLGNFLESPCGAAVSCFEIVALGPEIVIFPVKFPVCREFRRRRVRCAPRRQPGSHSTGDSGPLNLRNARQPELFVTCGAVSRLPIWTISERNRRKSPANTWNIPVFGRPEPETVRDQHCVGWDAVSFNLKETKPDRPAPQGLEIPKNFICPLRRSSP
jgi:hypothetical protein